MQADLVEVLKEKIFNLFMTAKQQLEDPSSRSRYDREILARSLGFYAHPKWRNTFPGAQPMSFKETSLDMIQRQQTVVCEKTDGFRYFLVETRDHAWFLIDRRYGVQQVFIFNSEWGR